jgi:hypothetical protein
MTGSLTCTKCGRACQYRKQTLIERYGADIRLPDLREQISQCKRRGQMHDACNGALYQAEAEIKIKGAAPNAAPHLQLSTVRDHEGTGQLDPQTVANSNTVRRPSSQFKALTTSNSAERGGENRYFLTLVPAANVEVVASLGGTQTSGT